MPTYNIDTLQKLQDIAPTHLADDCVLLNDIDASGTAAWNPIAGQPNEYNGFIPIGTQAVPFTGSFDGGGFTISNLYVRSTDTTTTYPSLLGFCQPSNTAYEFKDVSILDATIISVGVCAGGILAGYIGGSDPANRNVVSNVVTSGTITFNVVGFGGGGCVGSAYQLEFTDCSTSITYITVGASVGTDYIGGMVGYVDRCDFTDCEAGGSINSTITADRDRSIGGFCGAIVAGGAANQVSHLTGCKASVAILSDHQYATASG